MGKSLYIQHMVEQLQAKIRGIGSKACVTVPLHGPQVSPDIVMDYLVKCMQESACTRSIFHLDIAPNVSINAELEIRIHKCTDIMSIHYQICTDIFKFCLDICRFCHRICSLTASSANGTCTEFAADLALPLLTTELDCGLTHSSTKVNGYPPEALGAVSCGCTQPQYSATALGYVWTLCLHK